MTEEKKPKPKVADSELEKLTEQFDNFDNNIQKMTLDRMNQAPVKEVEPQTKLSQSEIEKSKDIYLKPARSIASKEKFDEKWRRDFNFSTEYVRFTAENKEIIGEILEFWTKPFPGMPSEFWKVPVNKPIWAPRHVAERIKGCKYHRLVMDQHTTTGQDGAGQYYGAMVVDNTIQRLDALPVSPTKSVFMGAHSF